MEKVQVVQLTTVNNGADGDPWTTITIGGEIDHVQDLPADTRFFFDGPFSVTDS